METAHARSFPEARRQAGAGLEKDLCPELAAEEEEHVAMLETAIE